MHKTELTGRTRHRIMTRRFGGPLLVLQVEERRTGTYDTNVYRSIESEPYEYTVWRDARIEDLTTKDVVHD